MRGTQQHDLPRNPSARITPARAGNTILQNPLSVSIEDHPRSCGEHAKLIGGVTYAPGSPPLVRGTLAGDVETRHNDRITPARAGNTRNHQNDIKRSQDHPRSCGEHKHCRLSKITLSGSPPLVRGTLGLLPGFGLVHGITPARAGNT